MSEPRDTEQQAALVELARRVAPDADAVAMRAAKLIRDSVTTYGASSDPTLDDQVFQHCRAVLEAMLDCMVEDRSPVIADFRFTTDVALSRVSQGIVLPDFLRAFRLAHKTYWNHLVNLLRDMEVSQDLITRTVELLIEVIEIGSSAAAAAYLEAEQYRLADQDRLRRDLMEDLILGRQPVLGPRRGMLTAAGLIEDAPFLMCSAVLVHPGDDQAELRQVRAAIRQALGGRDGRGGSGAGLVVARYSEVVGMLRVGTGGPTRLLNEARAALKSSGIEVAIGVSTEHRGWETAPEAYREAGLARDSLTGVEGGGVAPLSSMSPLTYLTLADDPTAYRLVDARVAAFVTDELASDGTHLATLEAYVAGDLNATAAAERLKVHVNTVYYRLDRVAERTGTDLRRFSEVMELVVAVRLLQRRHRRD